MSIIQQRERGFENAFVNASDLTCRTHARRNVRLGFWAAGQLGKTGDDAAEYAQAVVTAEIEGTGDDSVFAKLQRDFRRAGVATTDQQIRRQMELCLLEPRPETKAA